MYQWRHTDPDLSAAAERGLARAERGDWSGSSMDGARELRALLVLSASNAAALAGTIEHGEGTLLVRPDPDPTAGADVAPGADRTAAAAVLLATWDTMVPAPALPSLSVSTTDDYPRDTAGIPLPVAVVVVVAASGALAYLGYHALDVVDHALARRAELRALLQAHAAAERLVDSHLAAEASAGRQLPLDDATRYQLDTLSRVQRETASRLVPPPASNPLNTLANWLGAALLVVGAAYLVPLVFPKLK
jgi:hypothetical protein